jgi:hypothetical protein
MPQPVYTAAASNWLETACRDAETLGPPADEGIRRLVRGRASRANSRTVTRARVIAVSYPKAYDGGWLVVQSCGHRHRVHRSRDGSAALLRISQPTNSTGVAIAKSGHGRRIRPARPSRPARAVLWRRRAARAAESGGPGAGLTRCARAPPASGSTCRW